MAHRLFQKSNLKGVDLPVSVLVSPLKDFPGIFSYLLQVYSQLKHVADLEQQRAPAEVK